MNARSTAVIITAKDAAATAARAVSSALAQEVVSEVVFVDDGSCDETSSVAASVDDGSGRLKIIRHEQNHGPSHGRNVAIQASSAPFLCILDADDFMSADRLKRLFDTGGNDWDLLADNILLTIGPEEALVFDHLLMDNFLLPCDLTLSSFSLGNLPRKNRHRRELGFLKPLIRRSFVSAHGLSYDERLRLGEDLLYFAECLIHGARFRVVETCGYYAIQRSDSLSAHHHTHDIAMLYQSLLEFERKSVAAGRSVGKLPLYTQSVRHNLALRRALDAKREGGWPSFLAALGGSPADINHVLYALVRAKLSAIVKRDKK